MIQVIRKLGWLGLRVTADVVAEDDGFGDFLHRAALLAALPLNREIRLLFIQSQITLQDSFRAFDYFASLQLLIQGRVHLFQARQFDFSSDQKSDGRDHSNLAATINVVMAMLQVQHADHASSAHQWNREKSFVAVFGEFVEKLKPRVVRGALGDGDGFAVLGDPSGNSLPHAEFQAIDHFGMRILGSAKDEFVTFEHVDEAGVTLYKGSCKIHNTGKNLMKTIGRAEADGDVMEDINLRVFYRY